MLIDCDGCAVRDLACGDCVVTVLLGLPGTRAEVDEGERRALDVLADSGLVPRLQLVPVGLPDDLRETGAAAPAGSRSPDADVPRPAAHPAPRPAAHPAPRRASRTAS